jgi:hypothetical protein
MENEMKVERIFEPRLVINGVNRYIALIGANNVNYRTIPAPTVSQSALVWTTIDPPNGARTIIGRKIYITVRVSMQFTTAAGTNTQNILIPGCDGVRAYPFSSCVRNLQAQLNGQSITTSFLADTIHARSRYFQHQTTSLNLSSASSMKDRTQEYSDMYMKVNNPLGILGDSGLFAGETRGVVSNMTIIENSPTSAQLNFYVTEPVILFPFEFATNANETGISQVERMQLEIQYDHLNRMWCHNFTNGSAIDTMRTTLIEAYLHINYISPPNSYELPSICVLPFDEFQPIPTDVGMFQPGEVRETDSTVVQFGSVPQQLFVYAKMRNADRYSNLQNEIGSTDTFAAIEQLVINYDNQAGILAEARPIQLYQACVANGLQDSFQEWVGEVNDGFTPSGVDPVTQAPTGKIGTSGTVVRLMFGKDIAASGSLIPGLLGRSTFIVRARIKNVNFHRQMGIDLWVVPVYEGLISFSNGTGRKEIAPLTSTELVASAPVSSVPFTSYEAAFGAGIGGSILGMLGSLASKVIPTVASLAPMVAPHIGRFFGNSGASQQAPLLQVASPSEITPRIEPSGAPVGAPLAQGRGLPFAFPPHYANAPVGAINPEYLDTYRQLKNARRTGQLSTKQSKQFKLMRDQVRAYKGKGLVANGLVNETAKGGQLASLSRLRRQY